MFHHFHRDEIKIVAFLTNFYQFCAIVKLCWKASFRSTARAENIKIYVAQWYNSHSEMLAECTRDTASENDE